MGPNSGLQYHKVSAGALARLINYKININYKTISTTDHHKRSNRSHTGKTLALKILYEQETAVWASCVRIVLFDIWQALAIWEIVSGIKWPYNLFNSNKISS